MIEIANDNHIGNECIPLTKDDLKDIKKGYVIWECLSNFQESIDSSMFSSYESGVFCCEHDGVKYKSHVYVCADYDWANKIPEWATHIMWWGK